MNPTPRNIIFIGFMGTGKSTISMAVADRLGWKQLDTDKLIEQFEQRAIPDIFSESGEPYFRDLESRILSEALAGSNCVVSTGGGAVLSERNRENMKAKGYVIALTATAEKIIERVKQDEVRPLLAGDLEAQVRKLLQHRKHAYDFADLRIETTHLTVPEVVDLVVGQWHTTH